MQYLMQLSRGALHLTPSQRMCKYELNFQFQYNFKICITVLTNNNACEMLSVSSLCVQTIRAFAKFPARSNAATERLQKQQRITQESLFLSFCNTDRHELVI